MKNQRVPRCLISLMGAAILILTCGGAAAEEPEANFTFSPSNPVVGETVQFTDTSTGEPTEWEWDFDDDGTSTQRNPTHAFDVAGTYDVKLDVFNADGRNDIRIEVTVTGGVEEPVADFSFSPANPVVGGTVQFTDLSDGQIDNWYWDFDDGENSNEQSPAHVFDEAGTYSVELQVENAEGRDDIKMDVEVVGGAEEPEASFEFSPSEPVAGQSVQFTDTSTGEPTNWQWDFDDGTFSEARNPTHRFDESGSYEVRLTVENSAGDSDVIQEVEVAESEGEPEASFTFSPAEPKVGQAVTFTDTSGGGQPETWEWNFDDGETSSQQNPTHAFSEEGGYEVRLTVENSAGSSDVLEEIEIVANEQKPEANFSFSPDEPVVGQSVKFTDTSGGGQSETWEWDFDDGESSSQQSPTHSFDEEGSYEVRLTAENSAGSSDQTHEVTVSANESEPVADFSYSPTAPTIGQPVKFTDTSGGGAAETWLWDFDDGDTSSAQSPTHAFNEEGSYEVRLQVENSAGSSDKTHEVTVSATAEPPVASFKFNPTDPVVGQTVSFTDTSTGGAANVWEWSFGDDDTSNEQNPTHAYDEAMSYTVTLRAVNSEGSDTAAKTVKVEIGPILKEITFIPAASFAAGAEGSFYQTDIDIENGDTVLATFAFLWLPRSENNKQPVQSDSFMLGPGVSARYPNILSEVFGLSEGANGAIAIISDSEDLAVMSRTYNLPDAAGSGTFGQAIPGVPDDELLRAGDRGRIIFMSQDQEFRANLGCVNGRIYDVQISIELYDPEGTKLETKTMDLAPWSNNQLNKIFNAYAPTNGYAVVRSGTSGAAYYCYGSVLDNTSSDPTTITPVLK